MKLPRKRTTTIILAAVGLLLCSLASLAMLLVGADRQDQRYAPLLTAAAAAPIDAATEARIRGFCGDCHAVPRPASFHRDMWHNEVEKGYQHYARSGRTDLDPPPMGLTVAYFRSLAPEHLTYPEPAVAATEFRVSFRTEPLQYEDTVRTPPAIAGLCWARLRADDSPVLLASDMRSGHVISLDLREPRRSARRLAQLSNPCHIEPCDLDGDGTIDLLVADLGSFKAVDHSRGRVVWLRHEAPTGEFKEVVLASGLGRVADARPIDMDSRGRLDVIVAEFGWHRTGRILMLRNTAGPGQQPRFEPEELDPRTGTVHVPVYDLDSDGRPDFLALVSNEHECVEAFLNQGHGRFHRQTLWRAPDLTFGSNGIQLVDLNGDGKIDILYTNGDAFDNDYLSPWHGIQWLENLGSLHFEYHRLTDMPGACVALAGDFDGDGDLDIVAVSFLPRGLKPETVDVKSLPSIVLLEQVARGQFVRHTLERGFPCHAALVVGDFDHDGNLDFAIGNNTMGAEAQALGQTWAAVWWNRGRTSRP
jgi:hypothetical protein